MIECETENTRTLIPSNHSPREEKTIMRRKRIAVLMASIEREYQQHFASGLAEASAGYGIDICIFNSMGYMDVSLSTSETEESMIYDLPDLETFDGIISMPATMGSEATLRKIFEVITPLKGKPHISIASLPGMKERTVVVNGFSKAYAMTGWRLGYACGPQEIIAQMVKIHQYAIMCAPTTSQYAAVEALRNGDDDVRMMRESYNERRRFVLHMLEEMGIPCFEPMGAFYVFPCIKEFGLSSEEFANRLLSEEKVAIVPGTAFGDSGEGFLRISYAYSIDNLRKALTRLSRFVTRLREK